MGWISRTWVANINGLGGLFFRFLFTHPVQYRRVGLDGRAARRMARSSPNRHEIQIMGFAPLAAFLEEVGLMGRIARRLWTRSNFLPRTGSPAVATRSTITLDQELYDGPATLQIGGADHRVRVRLIGHTRPQSMVNIIGGEQYSARFPTDALKTPAVTLTVGEQSTPARIAECTPQGGHSIIGVGAPPFAVPQTQN